MKMILNEYRLMPWQKEAQQLVTKHMEDFFFGEGAALPPDTCRSRPRADAKRFAVSRTLTASARAHVDRCIDGERQPAVRLAHGAPPPSDAAAAPARR